MYCVCLFQFPRSLNFVAFRSLSFRQHAKYLLPYYRYAILWVMANVVASSFGFCCRRVTLLTTDCVASSWRRSVRAWRVCSTASSCPRGSRCRPRDVMFVVRLLCPGWPRTCRTRQTSRWWTARTRWGRHQPSCDVLLF